MNPKLRAVGSLMLLLVASVPGARAEGPDPQAPPISLASPDGKIRFDVRVGSFEGMQGVPTYRVSYGATSVLGDSRLGLVLGEGGALDSGLRVTGTQYRSSDSVEALGFGKASEARDHYNEVRVSLRQVVAPGRRLDLVVRAYDDGVAFRYVLPEQPYLRDVAIREETTTFAFQGSSLAYFLPLEFGSAYEYFYSHSRLAGIDPKLNIALPLLLQCPGDVFAAVTEGELTDYAGLYLGVEPGTGTLRSRLAPSLTDKETRVRGTVPFSSPWRVVLLGLTPGSLLESNVVRLLNPPPAAGDTSWIHPGKVVFGWWNGYEMPDSPPFVSGVNTATVERFIDFAAENGIPYVSLDGTNDEAWYGGPVGEYAGQDITRANPRLDLPAVLAYARAKAVRVRLWMHWRGLEKYMDAALPLYEQWGISGIMVDFINGDSQERVRFVTKVVREAARHHLTVNFHGVYKPTGIERTYPNLLSYEGVLGTEYDKWDKVGSTPEHEMDTLFVRMLAGPLDIHEGSVHPVVPENYAPNNRPSTQGTIARQMAAYVVYDNPLPMLADSICSYRKHPKLLPYLRNVPTVWDESRVLSATVDQHLAVARRSGGQWCVGAINARSALNLDIALGFLGAGDYVAEIISDGSNADAAPGQYDVADVRVTAKDTLHVRLARAGGVAVTLIPARPGTLLPRYR